MSDEPKHVCGHKLRPCCVHDWQPDPHGGGRFCPLCQAKEAQVSDSICICGHRHTQSLGVDDL